MEQEKFITCPACYSVVSNAGDRCPNCNVDFYSCSSCGAIALKDDKTCKQCNEDLDEEIAEDKYLTPVSFNKRFDSFKSLNLPSNILIIAFSVLILLSLISIYSFVIEINLTTSLLQGNEIDFYELDKNDMRFAMVGLFFAFIWITTWIVYLFWVRRAYKNLPILQSAPTQYTPGWAIGSYFVPILNLFIPFQIMREIWVGSKIEEKTEYLNNSVRPRDSILHYLPNIWWAIFLLDFALSTLSFKLSLNADTPEKLLTSDWVNIAADISGIVLFTIFIFLIWSINKMQTEKSQISKLGKCFACGNEVKLDSTFCVNCGAKLVNM